MCPYLYFSRRNPHTIIWSNRHTLWSRRQFSCRPILVFTLSTSCFSCTLSAGYCLAVRLRGRFFLILCNIFILLDFSSFLCFIPAPYLCGCRPYSMCFSFFAGGGGVIVTWTGRGRGDCVAVLFLFVCVFPSMVLGPHFLWSWRRLYSPCLLLTGIVEPLAAAVPTVAAW